MKIRVSVILSFILSLSLLLTACSSTPKETIQYEIDPQTKASIKVMYPGGTEPFMKEYGDMFAGQYPNVEISVINFTWNNYKEVVKEEKPDVLTLGLIEYIEFIGDNKLYDLNDVITNDNFNLEDMHPGIIDILRQYGNGKLYGLPPTFLSRALFYNKDLFDKYSVPYPTDGMTWGEVLDLAKRFPAEDGVNGLFMRDFNSLQDAIALAENLSVINTKKSTITIDTEEYKKVFEMIFDAYESKAVLLPDTNAFEVYDPFISGTSAMTMDYYYYLNNQIYWAKAEKGDEFQLNWDLASAPAAESSRDASSYYYFGDIFSVNAESENKQVAWELVKFVNSDELAKQKSRTTSFFAPTRTQYLYNPDGKRVEAFYNQKPQLSNMQDWTAVPDGFVKQMNGIITSEAKTVMVGAKTLDEAMASMQERGQQWLDEKKNEKSNAEGK